MDDEVELVEIGKFHFNLIVTLDELDSLIGCHKSLLHHLCLLQLQALQLLLAVLHQPLLDYLHFQRFLDTFLCLSSNPLPALKDYLLVFIHLRVPILSPFLLDDLVGNQTIERGVAAFEYLFVWVDLADLLMDVFKNHAFLYLISLEYQVVAMGYVQLQFLHCCRLQIHALLSLI